MWKEADRKVGAESIEKGDTFEKVVSDYIMPIIMKRAKIDPLARKVKIVNNCRWIPRSLGEIDLAIL